MKLNRAPRQGGAVDQVRVPAGADEPSLDRSTRLRAALALCFDASTAARLAAPSDTSPRRACRLAARHYTLLRLRGLLSPAPDAGPPLAPRRALGARSALALALHLGVDIETTELAAIFACSIEQIAQDLDRARRVADAACPAPCGRAPALACYREPLDPAAWLALNAHLRMCDACRAALEGYQRVDRSLLAAIDERAQQPAPGAAPTRPWHVRARRLGALSAALVLLAGLTLAGLTAAHALSARHARPVPLLAHAPAAPVTANWQVELDASHALVARDLATGQTTPLGPGSPLGELDLPYVAPSGDLIAIWTRPTAQGFPTALAAVSPAWLAISDLRGTVRWRQVFDSTDTAWTVAGWLGDRFLLVEVPRAHIGESAAAYRARIADQYRLVAVDAVTGARQAISQGGFAQAQPSPDGRLIALTTGFDERIAGRRLELRPVTGDQLGAPLIHLDRELASPPIWSPDGSRLIVNLLPADAPDATPSDSDSSYETGAARTNLAVIDRSGRLRPLAVAGDAPLTPVALAPDGSLVALSGPAAGGQSARRLLRVPLNGGAPVTLLDAPVLGVSAVTSSPDQRSLLLSVSRGSYLTPDSRPGYQQDTTVTELLRLGPDGSTQVLGAQPGAALDLAWLTPSALAPAVPFPEGAPPAPAAGPQPVAQLDGHGLLAAGVSPAPSGRWLVLDNGGQKLIWERDAGQSQALPPGLSDAAWLPGGDGLIGVLPVAEGGRQASRLAIYTPPAGAALDQSYTTQLFDPAGIGARTDLRYARPLVAPDGLHTAFFVIDRAHQRVALWVAGWDAPARQVDEWSWPDDQPNAISLAASWADDTTLLEARADDWRAGLPQQVTLLRLTLGPGGAERTPLLSLHSLGGDRGIALTELALSPDQGRLAYRVRHFTSFGPSPGVVDTITLAPAGDLDHRLELARGGGGQGLAWSPDGSRLAASLSDHIQLVSAGGETVPVRTPAGAQASDPVWLGSQLWFNLEDGSGARVWRLQPD